MLGHLLMLIIGCPGPADAPETPEPYAWHWVQADGRMVVHRGVNLNNHAKRRPEHHHGLDPTELALLPANGITLVRFLVFWEAMEPEEGIYDETYLAQVRADLLEVEALGLEVIVDVHQDVYGEGFGFTGFPTWTCSQEAYDAFVRSEGYWFLNYSDPNVVGCFDAFWASADLQDAYAAMTARLVAEVVDIPAVVGLDVMNEPFWGSLDAIEHDEVALPAFYARVVEAVRAEAPTLRIFLEPSLAASITAESRLDLSGLAGPLGFAPHFYPPYAELGTGWDGTFAAEAGALGGLSAHARTQGVPLFLGEFGIFSAIGNEDGYVREVRAAVETDGGSVAYWSFDHGSNLLTQEGEAGWLLPVFGEIWPHRIPGRLEGLEDQAVRFTLYGEGEVEWMAPFATGCAAEAEGAEVVATVRDGTRVQVGVVGDGLVRLALRCD
ncbi:MAG: cellulase family glycosylhydrolase [Deltaproteobacteria bacterium]|nr:cellulase family glycosylhydrolase [Deltaproteobacteria bacterium]MBW2253225.1 cellulase family glycosylhydrolase [Deltaproteobacteria bacterium]